MVDIGESGEFVSSDESWVDGRKDGKCPNGFRTALKCMSVITVAENGMEP